MSSSNISSLQLEANNFNYAAMMVIRCYCCVAIPFGIFGGSMSVYVFTRPTIRKNPCSMYFLAASIIGLLISCYNLPMRIIQAGFVGTDPGAHSVVFCKITWFILNSDRGLNSWLIVLACADRYLCSSASTSKRSWSSIRVAHRAIPITILLGFIAFIHVPIFYQIDIIPATQKPFCNPTGPAGTYRIILSYFNLLYFGLSPSFCMFIFGLLTIRNVERSKRLLVMPSTGLETTTNQKNRKTNRQLLQMLCVQVLVYSVTGLAYSIVAIIISISGSQSLSIVQVAQENLMIAAVGMAGDIGPNFSFFLFTLSSSLFRKEIKNLFRRFNRTGNLSNLAQRRSVNTVQTITIATAAKY